GVDVPQLAAQRGEPGQLVHLAQVSVADVVDPPGQRVDGAQGGPFGSGEQPDPVVEVARPVSGYRRAPRVGLVERAGHDTAFLTNPLERCRTTANRDAPGLPDIIAQLVFRSLSIAALPPAMYPATARRAQPRSIPRSGVPDFRSASARSVSYAIS